MLAPNSPLRAAVTALALVPVTASTAGPVTQKNDAEEATKRSPARYLWAKLIARIFEVFRLLCLHCGGQMRLIAFVTDGAEIRKILDHIGEPSTPPKISHARGPPLWDACDAETIENFDAEPEPEWDVVQRGPEVDFDQSVNW